MKGRTLIALAAAACMSAGIGGCAAFSLIGAMAQAHEEQMQIEVLPKYDLQELSVAVIVETGMDILYEHPNLVPTLTSGISLRLARDVPNVRMKPAADVVAWQWQNADWNTFSYGEVAEMLNVDRVVHVDIYEYRLNPPGNRWLWDGVCAATVSVIERDGFDPDAFAASFDIQGRFPGIEGVTRESATAAAIQRGVLTEFVKRTSWLFHKHLEPKYPDRFRPELQQ